MKPPYRCVTLAALSFALMTSNPAHVDGLLAAKRDALKDHGLSEKSQEAIIIFHDAKTAKKAVEDLILKIRVEGKVDEFAWVIPLPNEPQIAKADARLFEELFEYVAFRKVNAKKKAFNKFGGGGGGLGGDVDVLSRKVVGSYETAVVKERSPGTLNAWLAREGYQPIDGGEELIGDYRAKDYVFVCVKVSEAALAREDEVDLHPLHFRFLTGGRDGIYYPMRITGLEDGKFDVNLYIFYRFWLNGDLNRYGYTHRGFKLHYRDWDSPRCVPNAGKAWSAPRQDPFLQSATDKIEMTATFFRKHYPRSRFYLTNVRATDLDPDDVRVWPDDLWLFPHYTSRRRVPYDARPGAPAAGAYVEP